MKVEIITILPTERVKMFLSSLFLLNMKKIIGKYIKKK